MLEFPEPPRSYSEVFLEDTDKSLPAKLDPNTRYAMFTTIAKGGKSLIKSCKDLHLSRVVCYKTLRPEFAQDEIEQQRLLREARVSAMLQHPNTVPTYELGRDKKGNYYFTMKLVHGYTLREILNYRERYDLTQLVDVLIQIGHALTYAHTHGVAHRDIKPENILVGPYGEVVLLDWGLAKVWQSQPLSPQEQDAGKSLPGQASKIVPEFDEVSRMTAGGQLQGTVCYMSPEQVERDPEISYQTDVYSLGAVLYEVLCGATPFTGEKVHEVVHKVLTEEPPKPSIVSSLKVPEALEQLAMVCLQKDPNKRPADVGRLVRSLQEDWQQALGSW